jgi:ABC-2 type transport system permease protein
MLYRIAILIRKELQTLLRDRQGRLLLVVPVLLQILVFPNAATLEVKHDTLAMFNEDLGAESTELVQRFAQAGAFSKILMLHNDAEMRRTIDEQKALLVLRIPPDFSRNVAAKRPANIQAVLDGRRSNSGQIGLGYIQQILQDYETERGLGNVEIPRPKVSVRHWFNPNLYYEWFIVPCLIAIITTIGTLIVTSLSIAREREQGTFDQLLVSPYTPGMIMVGKTVPALLVALVQATIILVGGVFLYGIPFQGSLLLLYISMVGYILALIGFGLFISALCGTQQQAFLGVFCFMVPAVLLSGFVSPVDNMPGWLQAIVWVNPLRHFIPLVKGLFLKDIGWVMVAHGLWPLLLIAVVTGSAANWIFRRRFAS